MEHFDVIVIGGGPAGSAAAATAASKDLSVLLIDKADFPRDKLCGGLFTGRSARAMARIHGVAPDDALFRPCNQMRFVAGHRKLAQISDAPMMHLTMRHQLDAHLLAQAAARGVTLRTGHGLYRIDEQGSTLIMTDGSKLSYAALIAADGVNSQTARSLFGQAFDPDRIGFGLEVEVPAQTAEFPMNAVEIDFDAAIWGYGWAFPKAHGTTIGVGGINSRNPKMKKALGEYLGRRGITDPGARTKGQFLPFGDFRRVPGRGAILLAGDAAGLVDPITGEGIALAMESGALAAEAIAEALAAGAPATALRLYRGKLRPMHASLREARLCRQLIFAGPFRDTFKDSFARSQRLPRRYLDLLAGNLDYPDLRHDLLRRLPRGLWRAALHRIRQGAG